MPEARLRTVRPSVAARFQNAVERYGQAVPRLLRLRRLDVLDRPIHWHEGQIVEENLFYDLVSFMQQIGLSQ